MYAISLGTRHFIRGYWRTLSLRRVMVECHSSYMGFLVCDFPKAEFRAASKAFIDSG